MKKNFVRLFRLLLLLVALLILAALLLIGTYLLQPRPAKALKWSANGLKTELNAIPSDQVRAFFLARGFVAADAIYISKTGCFFRSAIGNGSTAQNSPAIIVQLGKWQIHEKGKGTKRPTAPRTREDWAKIWQQRGILENARIAFHWALFPTLQTYQANDYNWGMISFALPAKTRFDLTIKWQQGDQAFHKRINNLECGS